MTSPDYYLFAGSNCLEPSLGQFFLEYIPICNQVPRSVISTIVDNFMRNEKSLPKYLIHEKFKMAAFFVSEKQPQK